MIRYSMTVICGRILAQVYVYDICQVIATTGCAARVAALQVVPLSSLGESENRRTGDQGKGDFHGMSLNKSKTDPENQNRSIEPR